MKYENTKKLKAKFLQFGLSKENFNKLTSNKYFELDDSYMAFEAPCNPQPEPEDFRFDEDGLAYGISRNEFLELRNNINDRGGLTKGGAILFHKMINKMNNWGGKMPDDEIQIRIHEIYCRLNNINSFKFHKCITDNTALLKMQKFFDVSVICDGDNNCYEAYCPDGKVITNGNLNRAVCLAIIDKHS